MADRAILLPLFFALAPLVATGWRGWRWLVLAASVCLGALAVWVRWIVGGAGPDVHGFATAILMAFVVASALGLAAGALARAAGLALEARGWTRTGVLWTDLAALAAPLAFLRHFGLI